MTSEPPRNPPRFGVSRVKRAGLQLAFRCLRGLGLGLGVAVLLLVIICLALAGGWLIGWGGGDVARRVLSGSFDVRTLARDFAGALGAQLELIQSLLRTLLRQLKTATGR